MQQKSTYYLKFIGAILLLGLTFLSCEDQSKSIDDSFYGYQYFPLTVGKYRIYQVDSTVVRMFGSQLDKSRSYIKEEIAESFVNNSGDTVFRIERSVSQNQDGPYTISDVWTAERDGEGAYRTEENLRFNKLKFPIELGAKWQGNLFDNLIEVEVGGENIWVYKDWGDYELVSRGFERSLGGSSYSDVISIMQADHDFGIERRYSQEYYAPGIGLIERSMEIFDTQCQCPNLSWEQKAEAGFSMKQILVDSN